MASIFAAVLDLATLSAEDASAEPMRDRPYTELPLAALTVLRAQRQRPVAGPHPTHSRSWQPIRRGDLPKAAIQSWRRRRR